MTPSVVYIVPDKMGGMMNIIAGLLAFRRPDGFSYHAVLTHNHLTTDVRFAQPLACDSQTTMEYTLPVENLHAVIRRLAAAVPPGPGRRRSRRSPRSRDALGHRPRPRGRAHPPRRPRLLLRPRREARPRRPRVRRVQPPDVRSAARAPAASRRQHPLHSVRHPAPAAYAPACCRADPARLRRTPGARAEGRARTAGDRRGLARPID